MIPLEFLPILKWPPMNPMWVIVCFAWYVVGVFITWRKMKFSLYFLARCTTYVCLLFKLRVLRVKIFISAMIAWWCACKCECLWVNCFIHLSLIVDVPVLLCVFGSSPHLLLIVSESSPRSSFFSLFLQLRVLIELPRLRFLIWILRCGGEGSFPFSVGWCGWGCLSLFWAFSLSLSFYQKIETNIMILTSAIH